jgi:hypothetical protein
LQFVLNDGVGLMLIPTGGFGWIIGDRDVATRGSGECVLDLAADHDGASMTWSSAHAVPGRRPSPHQGTTPGVTQALSLTWTVTSQPFPS